MSDRYPSLIHTPVGQLLAKNLGLPNPVELERYEEGAPLVDGHRPRRRRRPARLGADRDALDELGHQARRAPSRRGRDVQGPGLRRHRHHRAPTSWSSSSTSSPRCSAASTRARADRARHPARAGQGPVASASRSARSRASPARWARRSARAPPCSSCTSRRRPRPARLHPRLPALPQVRLRLRPGHPHRLRTAQPTPRQVGRLGQAAGRQGRHRHRRQPRHRRADRPGAAPRRRDHPRHRRTPGGRASSRP